MKDYLIHKNHATRRKTYQALVQREPLRRRQRTLTLAMAYKRRVESRLKSLRAAARAESNS
jgi:hypothetical protein